MEQKIKEFVIDKLGIEEEEYSLDGNFFTDFGGDSLDKLDIILECEKEFNITIPDDQFDKINTPRELINYIKEHS
jgi:acyl carrier protein